MVCNEPNLQDLFQRVIFHICLTQTNELYPCSLWKLDPTGFQISNVSGARGVGRICTGVILCPDGVEFVGMSIW